MFYLLAVTAVLATLVSPLSACLDEDTSPAPHQDLSPQEYNQITVTAGTSTPKQEFLPKDKAVHGCGHSKYWNTQNRIVGGVEAMKNEFPWQVRLSISGSKGTYSCGAIVINTRWIMTAAHCGVLTNEASKVTGYFGDHDRSKKDDGEKIFKMEKIANHPDYNPRTVDMDFSLMKIKGELDFSAWEIQPVCLPASCDDECIPGDEVFITGWGTLKEGGESPNILHKARLPLVSNSECAAAYANTDSPVTLYQICAGYKEGRVDSCQGDSGGPMTCPNKGYHLLHGITSHGIGCARKKFYGVYARVCKVLPWMRKVMGGLDVRSTFFYSNSSIQPGNNSDDPTSTTVSQVSTITTTKVSTTGASQLDANAAEATSTQQVQTTTKVVAARRRRQRGRTGRRRRTTTVEATTTKAPATPLPSNEAS